MKYLIIGFVFTGVGYIGRIVLNEYSYRKLKSRYNNLLGLYSSLEIRLKDNERTFRKLKNDLLDLRRRYDKLNKNK